MNLGKTLKIHTGVCGQFLLLHNENTKWPNVLSVSTLQVTAPGWYHWDEFCGKTMARHTDGG